MEKNSAWRHERRLIGYAGLAPFIACLAVFMTTSDARTITVASDTLRHYAAVIASFLGAVHWGVLDGRHDPRRHARLRWGIMPALIGWTLLAIPVKPALLGYAALFALILIVDRRFLPLLDDTYRELRTQLTVVVVISLLLAAVLVPGSIG